MADQERLSDVKSNRDKVERIKRVKKKRSRSTKSGDSSPSIDVKRGRLTRAGIKDDQGRNEDRSPASLLRGRRRRRSRSSQRRDKQLDKGNNSTTTQKVTGKTDSGKKRMKSGEKLWRRKRGHKKRRMKKMKRQAGETDDGAAEDEVFQLDDGFASGFSNGTSASTDSTAPTSTALTTMTTALTTTASTSTASTSTTTTTMVDLNDIVAFDCEMVGVGWKMSNALARVSVVNASGDVLLDKYVIPPSGVSSITDYRTRYSGIRPRHMRDATPFHDVIPQVRRLFEGKVVVGHGLKGDFDVLGFHVPAKRVRNTLNCPHVFKLAQERAEQMRSANPGVSLPKMCRRLKSLTRFVLGRTIQTKKDGHDSVEDARAAMDLYLSVREMWESDLAAGIKYAANPNSAEANKTKPNPKPSTTNMTAKPRFSNVESSRDGSQVGGRKREESSDRLDESGSSQDAVDSNSTSSSPARRRSRTVTVTSEEMSEFVNDRYWTDFPDYTMDDYVY